MPAYIRSRTLPNGSRRHDVAYRRGGRGYKLEHAGTFRTMREATIRRDLVADWLAAGKNPKRELELIANPPVRLRVNAAAEQWLASRVDLDESTRDVYRGLLVRINDRFGNLAVDAVEPDDVSAWVREMIAEKLKPGTVNNYVRTLRMIMDVREDNPARDKTVRLPRRAVKVVEPPDAEAVEAMLAGLNSRYRMAVVLMEQTGMRVSEALGVRADDIDRDSQRVRVRPEVSKRDRPRWVPLEPWFAAVVLPTRNVDRHSIGSAMRRAAHINPHALRHRRATLWHQQGVVAVELANRLGHARASMSLDVYSHVRPLKECHPSSLLQVLGE